MIIYVCSITSVSPSLDITRQRETVHTTDGLTTEDENMGFLTGQFDLFFDSSESFQSNLWGSVMLRSSNGSVVWVPFSDISRIPRVVRSNIPFVPVNVIEQSPGMVSTLLCTVLRI